MSTKKTVNSIQQSANTSTKDSKNAKNGYQNRDNASKNASENGIRNK